MRRFLTPMIFAFLLSTFVGPTAFGQDDDFEDDSFAANETIEENVDSEVLTDEKIPATPEPTEKPKMNEYGEIVGGKPEDVLLERKKEQLDFKPGFSYDNEGLIFYQWSGYLSFGRQTANVLEDFETTDVLPEDYSMVGLEVNRHAQEMPIYLGLRFDQLSETVENSTVKMVYNLSLLTLMGGYKFIDSIISMSLHGGLVLGLSGTRVTSSLATDSEVSVPFKIGISYNLGVRTILHFKGMHIGLDAGVLALRNQEVEVGNSDENEFSSNTGGYLRGIIGRAF